MKKIYTIPDLSLKIFETENIVTDSAVSEPDKTTEQSVQAYINANGLGNANEIRLIW